MSWRNPIDPNAWSFPIPGVTGWRDRTEGPFWVRRTALKPYCVTVMGSIDQPWLQAGLACRQFPGFPCCMGNPERRRPRNGWHWPR